MIVGVTSGDFDKNRGKLNVRDSLMTRIKHVEETGFADEIIMKNTSVKKSMISRNTTLISLQ